MLPKWIRARALLLLPALLLAGCFLEEDSITIKRDGTIKFESLVAVPDNAEKIEFADLEKFVTNTLDELRQNHWKVEQKWGSKKRPYQFSVTGSGKLPDVVGKTSVYDISKVTDKAFRVFFRMSTTEGERGQRRIIFNPQTEGESTLIYDADAKPVTGIDNVSPFTAYTIVLK